MRRLLKWVLLLAVLYGLASVGGGILLAELALHPWRLPLRHADRAQSLARRFGAQLEDVRIPGVDGISLRAWHIRPAKGNGSTVLLFHGVSDNREGMMGYAEGFLSRGYTVLLPDSRAHGLSGGTTATYGLRETDDIRRWLDFVQTYDHPACMFGMGESMGAGLVLQTADDPRWCAIIAESGFSDFHEVAFDRVAGHLRMPVWVSRTVLRGPVEFAFAYSRWRYGLDFADASPRRVVARSHVPILLIHGLADTNIFPHQSEETHAANPTMTELWEPAGAAHCGAVSVAPAEFESRVNEILARGMKSRAHPAGAK